jgi:hypothetical protein
MWDGPCLRISSSFSSILREVYQVLADQKAAKHRQMRVIDESGEDYLYPQEYFVPIKFPQRGGESGAEGNLMFVIPVWVARILARLIVPPSRFRRKLDKTFWQAGQRV